MVLPREAWDAWLDPNSARKWLFATENGVMESCEIDPRVGGRFHIVERRGGERAEHFGEYVEIDPPRRLSFDFWTNFSEDRTRVIVTVAADGDGSIVTITHEAVWPDYVDRTRQGWSKILEGLEKSLS